MSLLKIFISSTCYDMKFIRENIENFIHELGHEPIMCENNIYYKQYCLPEQSCYDEISNCDILIHIIGGNFGSASDIESHISVAEAELITALKLHKPVFVFLYTPVSQEYQIYIKNKNQQMSFNVVKDPKVFHFINYIYATRLPVYKYEYIDNIKQTLKNQLSYLFSDKLHETFYNKKSYFDQNHINVSKEFIEDFKNCQSLSVFGLGQYRMIKSYYSFIEAKVISGKPVKYILSDPNGEGSKMCAKFSALHNNISNDIEMHKNAINLLMDIKALNSKHLKVKLVDIFPPFTMYAFNIESFEHLKIYVWFTPIYLPAIRRLGFRITGKQNIELCQYFLDQFNSIYSAPDTYEVFDKLTTNTY